MSTLPFSPLTNVGLLDTQDLYTRMTGIAVRDAVRYEAMGEEIAPIFLSDARRYAQEAEEFEAAYLQRVSHRSSPRPSSMGRRAIKSSEEEDVHTNRPAVTKNRGKWRRLYCYLQRSGATSKAKRRTRRRERSEAKRELARELAALTSISDRDGTAT